MPVRRSRAGGVAAEIDAGLVPLSAAARAAIRDQPALLQRCLTGGDDYELLLAVAPAQEAALCAAARATGIAVTRIGGFLDGEPRVRLVGYDGAAFETGADGRAHEGWSHFG